MASATVTPVVDDEFAILIPPLTGDERSLLEESILKDGCREPLLVWAGTDILLDGHNRLAVCRQHGIEFTIAEIQIADREAAVLWIIENQLGRRNLPVIDRVALVARREPLLRARAAIRQASRSQLPQNSAEASQPMEAREVAAAAAGVSHDTYTKGKHVLERGVPELVQAVRDGDASIHAAAQVAELPNDEQRNVIARGAIKDVAKQLANRRTKNTGNNEWYTPHSCLEAARQVVGSIDLDPASSRVAQERVRATAFYTKEDDGLRQPWFGVVWLNPPYARGLIGKFIEKLLTELAAGTVTAAILLVNNETDAAWFQLALSKATRACFPRGRLRFVTPLGKSGTALQGQALLYFGPHADRFEDVFGALGEVVVPVLVDTPARGADDSDSTQEHAEVSRS